MPSPRVEEVFKINGVPTYTFVRPKEYDHLLVSLRTPGRGVVVEGPSGIGKTTAVEKVLSELALGTSVTKLTARNQQDVEYIADLRSLGSVGTVIIDDFHKLDDHVKASVADYLKTLADEENPSVKLVVIGINRAGDRLISLASDLVNRIDIHRFESNPDGKVEELIKKGEQALNVNLNVRDEIVQEAQGSFYIAQLLSHETCVAAGVLEAESDARTTRLSFESIRARVRDRLATRFESICKTFCTGPRMRSDGRGPYLHLLRWLGSGREWSLSVPDALIQHPELSGSVRQIAEKGYLESFISAHPEVQEVLHYDAAAKLLTVEDPQFVFFVRNIPWSTFAREIGFSGFNISNKYDFALSFAGADRDVAERLFQVLQEEELEIFYDRNEQYRILGADIEEYLQPIYQSEAAFVVCLLGPEYPERVWTRIESEAFKERFASGDVIPIWFDTARPGVFDRSREVGGVEFYRSREMERQVREIAALLTRKLGERRRIASVPSREAERRQRVPVSD